ncbi:DUF488 family protein [Piscinibacter sakaiensis]|uniref:DUF488 domain-containing protein n=1 Tax=Piscinibacter sakaiensis TaxID=1547922 RepID=UPI003AABD395
MAKPASTSAKPDCRVLTVGHSTRPIDDFIALLKAHQVSVLVDVRTVPRSRTNPQFNADALAQSLAAVQIEHVHASGLGGFRRTSPESPNAGWRNLSFRGYADYMMTDSFAQDLLGLIELAKGEQLALMCAEAVPWRCHRSLIADALHVHGITACEIISPTRLQPHKMTPFARIVDGELRYPPEAAAP